MKTCRFMLFLLLCLQLVSLTAQTRLKRFELIPKETSQFSITVDHPDCAVLSVYSAISGLNFESNMGKIKTYEHRPLESRYVIFLYPVKQKISVKCPGYIESEFPIFSDPKAKQQYSFEVNEAMGTRGKGSLTINSVPTGAELIVDGIPIPDLITPRTIKDLLAMQYRITLKSNRYLDSTFVAEVRTDAETRQTVLLRPTWGDLIISTNPTNAKVFINGTLRGSTPFKLSGKEDGLDPGAYTLQLYHESDMYKEETASVNIQAGKTESLNFNLVSTAAKLRIESTMQPFKVYLNGTMNEELSAGRQILLPPQEYSLKVVFTGEKSKNFSPYEETLKLNADENRTLSPQFTSRLLNVSFSAELPNISLSIYDSDSQSKEYEGIIDNPIGLLPGNYRVIASKQGYLSYYCKLTVPNSAITPIKLLPVNAVTLLVSRPSLNKPKNLKVNKVSALQDSLKWDKVANIDGYIIDRKTAKGEWENGIISLPAEILEYTDKSSGSSVAYRIYCFSGDGISLATEMPVGESGMVYVEGGSFKMGSNVGEPHEKPAHKVTVSSFYIGKFEVSQKEWVEVMGCNPSYWKGDNLPVEQVSWYDAVEYCNKRSIKEGLKPCYKDKDKNTTCNWTANGYRLPSEAEWEYAARGGKKSNGYQYAGSNDNNSVAWDHSNSSNKTHSVGTKHANELGIFDMSGNVWEWSWDNHGGYPKGSQNNPHGANSGSCRVIRGGSCSHGANCCTASYRYLDVATNSVSITGFRVCRISP